jgi:hypothetical protein
MAFTGYLVCVLSTSDTACYLGLDDRRGTFSQSMIILVEECLPIPIIIDPQDVQTDGGMGASFSLLSGNSFVLSRVPAPSDTESNLMAHELGFLDVYHFGADSTTPSEPECVASFALPSLHGSDSDYNSRYIHIRCAPALTIQNNQFQSCSPSKIYSMAPMDRLLYIDMRITFTNARTEEFNRLYIAPSLLLDAVHKYSNGGVNRSKSPVVPWAHWAPQVSWLDSNNLQISQYGVFGQRTADFLYPTSDQLVILDVNQHRLKAHDMASMHTVNVLCVLGDGSSMDTHIVEGDVARSSTCPPASRRCRKTILKIGKSLDWLSEVIMDDERSKHIQMPVPITNYSYVFCRQS